MEVWERRRPGNHRGDKGLLPDSMIVVPKGEPEYSRKTSCQGRSTRYSSGLGTAVRGRAGRECRRSLSLGRDNASLAKE